MDFIERIFHFAPDAGSGFLELSIALVLLVMPLAAAALRKMGSASRSKTLRMSARRGPVEFAQHTVMPNRMG